MEVLCEEATNPAIISVAQIHEQPRPRVIGDLILLVETASCSKACELVVKQLSDADKSSMIMVSHSIEKQFLRVLVKVRHGRRSFPPTAGDGFRNDRRACMERCGSSYVLVLTSISRRR